MTISTEKILINSNSEEKLDQQWSDAAFMALPDDGNKYELVNGELVMSNSSAEHGYIAVILITILYSFLRSQKLGVVLDSSTTFTLHSGNKRSPDVSFIAKERLQGLKKLPRGFW